MASSCLKGPVQEIGGKLSRGAALPAAPHDGDRCPRRPTGRNTLHRCATAEQQEAGCHSEGGALLAILCYEAAHRKVLCAASHWVLQKTHVHWWMHARTHTHTHAHTHTHTHTHTHRLQKTYGRNTPGREAPSSCHAFPAPSTGKMIVTS